MSFLVIKEGANTINVWGILIFFIFLLVAMAVVSIHYRQKYEGLKKIVDNYLGNGGIEDEKI